MFSLSAIAQNEAQSTPQPQPKQWLRNCMDVSLIGATSGDVLGFNGNGWARNNLLRIGDLGNNQVVYKTAIGLTGSSNFLYNGNDLTVTAALNPRIAAIRASTGAAYLEARNTLQTWQFYVNGTNGGIEPDIANGNFEFRNLANTVQFRWASATGTFGSVAGVSTFLVNGKGGTGTGLAGYDSSNALSDITLGSNLQISAGALSINTTALAGSFWALGGISPTAQPALATVNGWGINFNTNGVRRMSLPAAGIVIDNTAPKIIGMTSTDSLVYLTSIPASYLNNAADSVFNVNNFTDLVATTGKNGNMAIATRTGGMYRKNAGAWSTAVVLENGNNAIGASGGTVSALTPFLSYARYQVTSSADAFTVNNPSSDPGNGATVVIEYVNGDAVADVVSFGSKYKNADGSQYGPVNVPASGKSAFEFKLVSGDYINIGSSNSYTITSKRLEMAMGASVASATNVSLGFTGNLFHITGTTTINTLTATWQAGSEVTLIFDAACTVNDNDTSAGNIKLAGGIDFSATADDVLKLVWDGTSWFEVSRSTN